MSPSGRCAHRYQSQRLPHRHEYHSPVSPAQPARLHPIRQLLRPDCSPPLLFQRHSKGAPLNRPEATIQATRPESVEEKNEFLNLVRSNEDMGKDYIIELKPPTTEEIRNARPLATVLPQDALTHVMLIAATLGAGTEDDRASTETLAKRNSSCRAQDE